MENVATFGLNVGTFQRVKQPTSRRSRGGLKPTSRRWDLTSRHCREGIFQRRDVESQRRDVAERLYSNVATFQGKEKLTSRR